jgi:hypothetical protein
MSDSRPNELRMWFGFDPELRHQLETIRQMSRRSRQTPTREWPLIFMERYDALLVIREWPDGSRTAYAMSEISAGGNARRARPYPTHDSPCRPRDIAAGWNV